MPETGLKNNIIPFGALTNNEESQGLITQDPEDTCEMIKSEVFCDGDLVQAGITAQALLETGAFSEEEVIGMMVSALETSGASIERRILTPQPEERGLGENIQPPSNGNELLILAAEPVTNGQLLLPPTKVTSLQEETVALQQRQPSLRARISRILKISRKQQLLPLDKAA